MKRIGMNEVKDILRQRHGLDLMRDGIAAATGVNTGTVSHVLGRALATRLFWPLPDDLEDDALRRGSTRPRSASLHRRRRRPTHPPPAAPGFSSSTDIN